MKKLFLIGDPLNTAYQIEGLTEVSFEKNGSAYQIESDAGLVGAVEFLLSRKSYSPSSRIHNCFVNDDAKIEKVLENNLDARLQDFNQGIDSNVFLARVLTAANDFYLSKEKLLPREISEYQLRAKAYYTFVDSLRKLNLYANNSMLATLIKDCRGTEMYKDGLLWGRSEAGNLINLPPEPIKKYIKSFEEGAVICKEGALDGEMYVLLKGSISVQVGSTFVAQLSLPGEAIGELSLFLDDRRSATLIADEKVFLYVIPQEQLLDFHSSHPDVFLIIARTTADRIYRVLERINRFSYAFSTSEVDQEKLYSLKKELANKGRSELRNLQKQFKEVCEAANDSRLTQIWERMQGLEN